MKFSPQLLIVAMIASPVLYACSSSHSIQMGQAALPIQVSGSKTEISVEE